MGVSPYENPVLKMIANVNILLTKEAAPQFIGTVMPNHQGIGKTKYNHSHLPDDNRKAKKK